MKNPIAVLSFLVLLAMLTVGCAATPVVLAPNASDIRTGKRIGNTNATWPQRGRDPVADAPRCVCGAALVTARRARRRGGWRWTGSTGRGMVAPTDTTRGRDAGQKRDGYHAQSSCSEFAVWLCVAVYLWRWMHGSTKLATSAALFAAIASALACDRERLGARAADDYK